MKHNIRMKRRLLPLLLFLLLGAAGAVAQSTMTEQQIITYIMEENEKGTSQQELSPS